MEAKVLGHNGDYPPLTRHSWSMPWIAVWICVCGYLLCTCKLDSRSNLIAMLRMKIARGGLTVMCNIANRVIADCLMLSDWLPSKDIDLRACPQTNHHHYHGGQGF